MITEIMNIMKNTYFGASKLKRYVEITLSLICLSNFAFVWYYIYIQVINFNCLVYVSHCYSILAKYFLNFCTYRCSRNVSLNHSTMSIVIPLTIFVAAHALSARSTSVTYPKTDKVPTLLQLSYSN